MAPEYFDVEEAIANGTVSMAGEKHFEPIFLCIVKGGNIEQCLKEGQRELRPIFGPDPLPIEKWLIQSLMDYKNNLEKQMTVIDKVLSEISSK